MKPTILMIHGHAPSLTLAPLAEALAREFNVVLPDAPGYQGLPPLPSQAPEHRAQLLEDALGDASKPVAVLGHSYGAYLALLLALRANIHITRIVCLSPTAHLDSQELVQMASFAAALKAGIDVTPMIQEIWSGKGHMLAMEDTQATAAAVRMHLSSKGTG